MRPIHPYLAAIIVLAATIAFGWNWPNRTTSFLGMAVLGSLIFLWKDTEGRRRAIWSIGGLLAGTVVLMAFGRLPGDDGLFLTEAGQQVVNEWVGFLAVTFAASWAGSAASLEIARSAVILARRALAWRWRRRGPAPPATVAARQASTAFWLFAAFMAYFVVFELRGIPSDLIKEQAPHIHVIVRGVGAALIVVAVLAGSIQGARDGRHMSLEQMRKAPPTFGGRRGQRRWHPR